MTDVKKTLIALVGFVFLLTVTVGALTYTVMSQHDTIGRLQHRAMVPGPKGAPGVAGEVGPMGPRGPVGPVGPEGQIPVGQAGDASPNVTVVVPSCATWANQYRAAGPNAIGRAPTDAEVAQAVSEARASQECG